MKFAFIHFDLTRQNGDPRMVLSLAKHSQEEGHEVKVYCAEFHPRCFPELHKDLSISVVPPYAPLNSVLRATSLLGRVIERLRRLLLYNDSARRIEKELDSDFDFVFCENDYSYKVSRIYKKRNPNSRVVWIMNNPQFYHSKKNTFLFDVLSRVAAVIEKISARKYAKWIDWVIVYDKENKNGAEKAGYKAKLMGNPLDYKKFYYPPRQSLTKNKLTQLLGWGVLSPLRRFEDIIEATAILRDKGYNVKALIFSKNYWGDSSYEKTFMDFAHKNRAHKYVEIRFGDTKEEEIMNGVRNSHIAVVPNSAKVWVATACEAMAAGLPLIISNKTSMADVLEDGVNAFLVNPFSPSEIVEKVARLIDDASLYLSMAKSGQKYVEDNLSFKNFVREMVKRPL